MSSGFGSTAGSSSSNIKAYVRFLNGSQIAYTIENLSTMFPETSVIFTSNTIEIHTFSKGNSLSCRLILYGDRIKADSGEYIVANIEGGEGFSAGMSLLNIHKTMGTSACSSGSMVEWMITKFPSNVCFKVHDKDGIEHREYKYQILSLPTPGSYDYEPDTRSDYKASLKSDVFKDIFASLKKTECKEVSINLYEHGINFSSDKSSSSCNLSINRGTIYPGGRVFPRNEWGKVKFSGVFQLDHLVSISKFQNVCSEMDILFHLSRITDRLAEDGFTVERIENPHRIDVVCRLAHGETVFTLNSIRVGEFAVETESAALPAMEVPAQPVLGAAGMPALGPLTPGQYISASVGGAIGMPPVGLSIPGAIFRP